MDYFVGCYLRSCVFKAWMEVGLAEAAVKNIIESLGVLDTESSESVEVSLNKVTGTKIEYSITFKSKRGWFHVEYY